MYGNLLCGTREVLSGVASQAAITGETERHNSSKVVQKVGQSNSSEEASEQRGRCEKYNRRTGGACGAKDSGCEKLETNRVADKRVLGRLNGQVCLVWVSIAVAWIEAWHVFICRKK